MTHEYTILLGGVIVGGAPGATAIAWAADTILAVGGDEQVRSISRGDSHYVDLRGAVVSALDAGVTLEPGAVADLVVRPAAAAGGTAPPPRAIIRAGRVTEGSLGTVPPD